MHIHNWHKWQMNRRDRAQPPWIKIHRIVLRDPSWAQLTDAEKGQLVSLWIVAADKDGILPDDPKILRKVAGLDDEPDIEKFKALGFIDSCQDDVNLTSSWRHDDVNLTPDGCHLTAKGKGRERREGEGRGAPPPAAAAVPTDLPKASPKQVAFARSLLEPHGLTLEDWMAMAKVEQLGSHHLDLIVAAYKGTKPPDKEAQRASLNTLNNELDFIYGEDGVDAAKAWIGRQDAANRPSLWRRLDAIRQEATA